MKRLALILLFAFVAMLPLSAAGTVAKVSTNVYVGGQVGDVRRSIYEWTADGSGNVNTNSIIVSPGAYLLQASLVPGTGGDQPDDNYDGTLLSPRVADLLQGMGQNADNVEETLPIHVGVWIDKNAVLQLTISGAGANNKGQLWLWWGPQ